MGFFYFAPTDDGHFHSGEFWKLSSYMFRSGYDAATAGTKLVLNYLFEYAQTNETRIYNIFLVLCVFQGVRGVVLLCP
jgi:hypothetical protein